MAARLDYVKFVSPPLSRRPFLGFLGLFGAFGWPFNQWRLVRLNTWNYQNEIVLFIPRVPSGALGCRATAHRPSKESKCTRLLLVSPRGELRVFASWLKHYEREANY